MEIQTDPWSTNLTTPAPCRIRQPTQNPAGMRCGRSQASSGRGFRSPTSSAATPRHRPEELKGQPRVLESAASAYDGAEAPVTATLIKVGQISAAFAWSGLVSAASTSGDTMPRLCRGALHCGGGRVRRARSGAYPRPRGSDTDDLGCVTAAKRSNGHSRLSTTGAQQRRYFGGEYRI